MVAGGSMSYQGGSLPTNGEGAHPGWLWSCSEAGKYSILTTLHLLPFLQPTALPLVFHLFPRCLRLGLQPLAYLWRQEQESLLSQMISSDLHAILIKVAAFGEFASHSFVSQAAAEQSHVPSLLVTLFTLFTFSGGAMLVKWCLAWGCKGQNLDKWGIGGGEREV